MNIKYTETKESIRIKNNSLYIGVVVLFGKQGNHFIAFAPSINVSGYGATMEEAKESFDYNIRVFASDLQVLSNAQKERELRKLGFSKEEYKAKNFSKPFSSDRDFLQDFNPGIFTTSFVSATA